MQPSKPSQSLEVVAIVTCCYLKIDTHWPDGNVYGNFPPQIGITSMTTLDTGSHMCFFQLFSFTDWCSLEYGRLGLTWDKSKGGIRNKWHLVTSDVTLRLHVSFSSSKKYSLNTWIIRKFFQQHIFLCYISRALTLLAYELSLAA